MKKSLKQNFSARQLNSDKYYMYHGTMYSILYGMELSQCACFVDANRMESNMSNFLQNFEHNIQIKLGRK